MSLLLDALKKAAEDKENNSAKPDSEKTEIEIESKETSLPEMDEELFLEDGVIEDSEETPAAPIVKEELIDLDLPLDSELEEALGVEQNKPVEAEEIKKKPEPLSEQELLIDEHRKNNKKEAEEIENKSEPLSEQEHLIDEHIKDNKSEAKIVVGGTEPVLEAEKPIPDNELPNYSHSDARKILAVSQKKYRSSQRMVYYGLYFFAALLFFAGSYLYYSTEILDNSDKPVFRSKQSNKNYKKTEKEIVIEQQVSIAKAKLAELDATENKNTKTIKNEVKKNIPIVKKKVEKKIIISKQKREDAISVLLHKAYTHYQSAEYSLASAMYFKVLARDQRQYDALLGVAAIAVVNKDYVAARSYYQNILNFYPRDSIARSALVDLARQEVSTANESQLNSLKRDNPEAAHVRFSLGLLYAKQGRVKESQQAFFDAFTLDKKADYAYNLAVMLDKLGQPKAALSYYKQASSLSDKGISHFNEKLALERILQLEGSDE